MLTESVGSANREERMKKFLNVRETLLSESLDGFPAAQADPMLL
jgi:hypothetical protein